MFDPANDRWVLSGRDIRPIFGKGRTEGVTALRAQVVKASKHPTEVPDCRGLTAVRLFIEGSQQGLTWDYYRLDVLTPEDLA